MADPVISLAKLKEIWNSQIQDENNWAFNKLFSISLLSTVALVCTTVIMGKLAYRMNDEALLQNQVMDNEASPFCWVICRVDFPDATVWRSYGYLRLARRGSPVLFEIWHAPFQ
ncbi:hypothetical protein SAY87_021319 [Trapa incisa]|uniref:Uncharacterized protein n=1 Tax=Trapa incisa TaxID=236973 RepID=A0AAN7PR28_9MYRT|nr:hypothetical protein SAY87_021319 [Trapa incisa]